MKILCGILCVEVEVHVWVLSAVGLLSICSVHWTCGVRLQLSRRNSDRVCVHFYQSRVHTFRTACIPIGVPSEAMPVFMYALIHAPASPQRMRVDLRV